MRICIFEDEFYRRLLPLTYLRPVFDLRCGQLTLREKIGRVYPDEIFILNSRGYLRDTVKEKHPGSYVNEIPADTDRLLLINGRLIFGPAAAGMLEDTGRDVVYIQDDTVVGGWLSGKNLTLYRETIGKSPVSSRDFAGIERSERTGFEFVNYSWDLVHKNGEQLISDFRLSSLGGTGMHGRVYEGAHLLDPDRIHIGKGAKIKPGAVLDAENGPVYIARNVEVMPNAVIRGPAFIGEGSIIKAGAKIYENTSIGEMCKIGGEVEESIIHANSNKQHEGFVGHSYIGEWVNIGADSNTSDLKNDYGNVKVYSEGKMVDTGLQFVGLTMGDHSKCGINSMFNTGTVVGVFCNIFGTGMPPKYVPSFSWGEASSEFVPYRLDKAVEVARRVMTRRQVELSQAGETLIKYIHDITASERENTNVSD